MNKRERISQWLGAATADEVSPEEVGVENNPYYRAFFRCWNKQQYYEAHDVLEQLWLNTKSADADYFKGLIQAAGAFVHLQKHFEYPSHAKHSRRLPPATRLFQLASKNLRNFMPHHRGLNVSAFCQLLTRYADEIVTSDYKTNPWSPETAPKLKLS
jgi:Domain of unknown function (DUF309)